MSEPFNPAIMYANNSQFDAGTHLEIPDATQSRVLLWCRGGEVSLKLNEHETTLTKGSVVLSPWLFTLSLNVLSETPAHLATIHLIPNMKPGAKLNFKACHENTILPHHKHRSDADIPGLDRGLLQFSIHPTDSTGYLINHIVTWFSGPSRNERTAHLLARHLIEEIIALQYRPKISLDQYPATLRRLLLDIDWKYNKGITLNDLMQTAQCGKSTLFQLFKTHLQMTPTHWIQHKKIEHAADLIISTNLNLRDIAYASGFRSPHYFSKTFKRIRGETPSELRKRSWH